MKLLVRDRKRINKEIGNLLKPIYFNQIPLMDIDKILRGYGYLLTQEDDTEWSGFLCGENSNATFTIGKWNTCSDMGDLPRYDALENAMLWMSWYRMPSGRYEIVAYIS